jgi:hypothetical protein
MRVRAAHDGDAVTIEDQELGEEDYEEVLESTPRERRLVTQPYDLSINTLVEQWTDGTLSLPEIQRQYVWDNARASRLIESLLLNVPIPVVYFAETDDLKYLVIDGHQRILSVVRFLDNQFALSSLRVLGDLNRKRFHQLSERDQRLIKTRVIRAIIISADSDPMMSFEVFERLNTGSIALNAQEVRNSTHRGPMNDLIKRFTENAAFRLCIGTSKPRPRMVDNELILRHLALEHGWSRFRPPLKRFLINYMVAANAWGPVSLAEAERLFDHATKGLIRAFPGGAFRLLDPKGKPIDRAINRALAEVQLTAFAWVENPESIDERRPEVLKAVSRLYRDQVFLDSVQRATGDRKRTLRRLGMYCEALEFGGLHLSNSVPHEPPE